MELVYSARMTYTNAVDFEAQASRHSADDLAKSNAMAMPLWVGSSALYTKFATSARYTQRPAVRPQSHCTE
jgi:hypothetical protein